MNTIAERVEKLFSKIIAVQKQYSCQQVVKLIAVSKQRPSVELKQAHAAGIHDFAENYCQEGIEKINQLNDLALTWHFIGRIQSNKTAAIAQHFDWVHTIAERRIAMRLNAARRVSQAPLNLCLQVNLDNDTSKAGIPVDKLTSLAAAVSTLQHCQLRGLMFIGPQNNDIELQRNFFRRAASLYTTLRADYNLDTLSMGMTADYQAAISEGATCVRIGTGLFGPRD